MNILRNTEDYLANGGIASHLFHFRNPTLSDQQRFWINYDPKIDSRHYFNPEGGPTEEDVNWFVPFSTELRRRLTELRGEYESNLESMVSVAIHRAAYPEDIDVNFDALTYAANSDSLANYRDIIEPFILDLQALQIKQQERVKKFITRISFGWRRTKEALEEIYDLYVNDQDYLIDQNIDKEQFIEAVTSNDVRKYSRTIKLGCETEYAALALKALRLHFANFSSMIIGKSEVFVTREGEVLKASNFRKAAKLGKEAGKDEEYIQPFFRRFNSKYNG